MNLIITIISAILLFSCAVQPQVVDPICNEIEYADSFICQQLHKQGYEAEDARDLILDANDISLVLEVYTVEELSNILDKLESYLDDPLLTYSNFFRFTTEDIAKATRVVSILKRRFAILQSNDFVRSSDVKLIRLAIQRIRESVGITS